MKYLNKTRFLQDAADVVFPAYKVGRKHEVLNKIRFLGLFLMFFLPFFSIGEEKPVAPKAQEWVKLWEEEKLKVRRRFPQYRKTFNHKAVQEKVTEELSRQKSAKSLLYQKKPSIRASAL